jgi:hypothetical protein
MIYVHKNFVDKSCCNQLIEHYKSNISKAITFRDTFPLSISRIENITDSLENLCSLFGEQSKLDLCQIVKWPVGSKQHPHFDEVEDTFASIIYLNDDYAGGKTCFENIEISPESGTMVFFTGNKILHWVKEVKNNDRYTLAHWFVRK